MQAIKKVFSSDDDKRSSSSSGRSAEVGNTGSLAHTNGPDSHSGAALAHNNPLSHNSTGNSSTGHNSDRTSGAGLGGVGSRDSEGLNTHHETLARAHDGKNGTLSHEHNVGNHASVPGEGASHDHRHLAAVTSTSALSATCVGS